MSNQCGSKMRFYDELQNLGKLTSFCKIHVSNSKNMFINPVIWKLDMLFGIDKKNAESLQSLIMSDK